MKLNFKAKNAYFQSRKWNMTLESFHLKIKDIFFLHFWLILAVIIKEETRKSIFTFLWP